MMPKEDSLTSGARQAEIAASFQRLSSRFNTTNPDAQAQRHAQPNLHVLGALGQPSFPGYMSPEEFFASQSSRSGDYRCGMCFSTFQLQADLIRHVAYVHPDVCTPPSAPPYPTPSQTFSACAPSNPYAHIFAPTMPGPTSSESLMSGPTSAGSLMSGPSSAGSLMPESTSAGSLMSGSASVGSLMPSLTSAASPMSGPTSAGSFMPAPISVGSLVPEPVSMGSLMPGMGFSVPIQPESLKPSSAFVCDICDVCCDTKEQLDRHKVGQKHRKKAELHASFQQAALTFAKNGISEQKPGLWVCSFCNYNIEHPNEVRQHLESVKHRRHAANADTSHNQPFASSAQAMSSELMRLQAHLIASHNSPILNDSVPQNSTAANVQSMFASINSNAPGSVMPSPSLDSSSSSPTYKGAMPFITKSSRSSPLAAANIIAAAANGNNLHCSACGVSCNSMSSFAAHLSSSRHQRRMNTSSSPRTQGSQGSGKGSTFGTTLAAGSFPTQSNGAPSKPRSTEPVSQRPDVQFHCDICEVDVCGRWNYEAHTHGKNHIKRARLRDAAANRTESSSQQSPSRDQSANTMTDRQPEETPPQATFSAPASTIFPTQSLNNGAVLDVNLPPSQEKSLPAPSTKNCENNPVRTQNSGLNET